MQPTSYAVSWVCLDHAHSLVLASVHYIYSGTSDNGHSDEWTTSLQWTHCSAPAYLLSIHFYLRIMDKMLAPTVSIIRRFHCILWNLRIKDTLEKTSLYRTHFRVPKVHFPIILVHMIPPKRGQPLYKGQNAWSQRVYCSEVPL